jgi:hypothetical protein
MSDKPKTFSLDDLPDDPPKQFSLDDVPDDPAPEGAEPSILESFWLYPNKGDIGGAVKTFGDHITASPVFNVASEGVRRAGAATEAGASKLLGNEKDYDKIYDEKLAEYHKDRAANEAKLNKEAKEHPTAALFGSLGSATVDPTPGFKGTSFMKKIAAMFGNTGEAAALAFADTISRGGSYADAWDSAKSAAKWGGAINSVPVAAHAASSTKNAATQFGRSRTIKALDPILSQQEVLQNKGLANKMADELHDAGVVRFGSSVEDMAPRVEEVLQTKGRRIGDIRDAVDAKIRETPGEAIDLTRLGKKAEVQQAFLSDSNLDAQAQAKKYAKNVESLLNTPRRSIEQTQQEVGALSNAIPFSKSYSDMTPKQRSLYDLRRDLVESIDDRVNTLTPELSGEYGKLKQQFGLFKEADKILDKSVARQARNNDFGLRDLLAANTSKDGLVKSSLMAVVSKLARERGNSALAASAYKAADLMGSAPEKFGAFSGVLERAAERGPDAFIAAHQLLYTSDKNYRTLVDETAGEDVK